MGARKEGQRQSRRAALPAEVSANGLGRAVRLMPEPKACQKRNRLLTILVRIIHWQVTIKGRALRSEGNGPVSHEFKLFKSFNPRFVQTPFFVFPRDRGGRRRWGLERLEQLERFEPDSSADTVS